MSQTLLTAQERAAKRRAKLNLDRKPTSQSGSSLLMQWVVIVVIGFLIYIYIESQV